MSILVFGCRRNICVLRFDMEAKVEVEITYYVPKGCLIEPGSRLRRRRLCFKYVFITISHGYLLFKCSSVSSNAGLRDQYEAIQTSRKHGFISTTRNTGQIIAFKNKGKKGN